MTPRQMGVLYFILAVLVLVMTAQTAVKWLLHADLADPGTTVAKIHY